jgi:signal transduction histidine kinase
MQLVTALVFMFGGATAPALAQPVTTPTYAASTTHDERFITVFDRADFVQSPSLTPPDANTNWQSVALPDSWRKQQRPTTQYGWYRMRFIHRGDRHQDAASGQRAIFITRITNNIEIYLNGQSFGVSGRLGREPEESWNLAQFYYVPSSLIKDGDNELLIRLHPDGYARAGLAQVQMGDSAILRPRYSTRYFVQTTAPQLITAVLVVMAIAALTLWLRRRNETMFLLFGLMCVAAVVRLFHHYLRDTPVWLALMAVPAMCWLTTFQVNFALHYAKRPLPGVERALIIFAAAATGALYLGALLNQYGLATLIVYAVLAILTPVLAAIIIYQLSRKVSRGNILMIVATLLNSVFGIHDFLNFQELLGFDRMYLLPLGLPLLLLAVAALLIRRFVDTLRDYEALNSELAVRITDREQALAASFARERQLDQQRASADERQRLMRDMHDGLGSHLMSTLALMKRGSLTQAELESALADCIDELKLTIDSLEPVERDLLVVLGNLRYRLEPRLHAAGISLEWAVTDLPALDYLDPENVRSVLRIVQEAFTNTLKHAHAKRITLSTGVDHAARRVWVRVTDDGQSFDPSSMTGGRGLANMTSRAVRMHGQVEVFPLRGGGTCVNILLPLKLPSS